MYICSYIHNIHTEMRIVELIKYSSYIHRERYRGTYIPVLLQ